MRCVLFSLQWRHDERDGVSNHQPHDCLPNGLFKRRSKKTSKLRVTDLCGGNSPVTGEFPTQRASNAENVSIWWRHHELNENLVHNNKAGHVFCRPLLWLLSWYPLFTVKSLQHISKLGIRRWNLQSPDLQPFKPININSSQKHGAMITSSLRQNDVATSFWRNNDVIITSGVRWKAEIADQQKLTRMQSLWFRLLISWLIKVTVQCQSSDFELAVFWLTVYMQSRVTLYSLYFDKCCFKISHGTGRYILSTSVILITSLVYARSMHL